ncbi:MAG: hypothetical protein HDS14_00385 [Bacteroides sp.]|nr:hypothetical protein [Bacteroides sp.]
MAENIGYTPMTSFWDDFSIAELYGPLAIADTLERAFKGWKHDVKYIAELSLVLNHKGLWYWQAAERFDNNPALQRLSELYFHAWEQLHDWAQKNFTGEAAEYYFNVTD